jgi:hypothetical protein
MLNTNFKYGVEIEFINADLREVERTMRDAGIDVVREGYNHTTRNHWKIVTDQTVSTGGYSYSQGLGNGGELVSPILCGDDGLRELEAALAALNSHPDVSIDRRCGLHVHVSWDNMQSDHIQQIVRRYAKYEHIIDGWMPRSRRGSSSRWCSSTVDHTVERVRNMSDLSSYRAGINRDCKVNLDAYARHGTIEFRQHSGTTDFNKISNWVKFLLAFVDNSKPTENPIEMVRPNRKSAYGEFRSTMSAKGFNVVFGGGRGTSAKYKVLNSYGDCQMVLNWYQMEAFHTDTSVPGGPVVRRSLDTGKVTRFYKTLAGVQDDLVTDEAETVYRGVSQEVKSYLEERASDLS